MALSTDEKIAAACKKQINWPSIISIFITIIGLTVGAVVWASNAHSDIKSWTIDGDHATKVEIKETIKEQYVPLHRFTKVEQQLENQNEKLEKLDGKLDQVLEGMRNRHFNDNSQ